MEPRHNKLKRRGLPARFLDFLWLVLPAITLISVAAYFAGALALRTNPPALAIASQAMNPTIKQGDLAIIQGVDARVLKPGEIIAIKLTGPEESKYQLPGEIVRRIVKITRSNNTELFITKGDGNPANDPFSVTPSAISGKVIGSVPLLGFPILFFSSKQGIIFLIATAIILFIYYILGFMEDRRHYAHATAATMQNVLEMVGYVHDAVQENHSVSLEKLAFPGIEFQESPPQLNLDVNGLFPAFSASKERGLEQPTSQSSQLAIQDELRKVLEQSIKLREAADWLSTGEISGESISELLGQYATTIEELIAATGDPELLNRLQNTRARIIDTPLPSAPTEPAPKTFPEFEGGNANQPGNVSDENLRPVTLAEIAPGNLPESLRQGGKEPRDEEMADRVSNVVSDSSIAKAEPEKLLEGEAQLDFIESQGLSLDTTENAPLKDGADSASGASPSTHANPSKRHRRRSLRRRD